MGTLAAVTLDELKRMVDTVQGAKPGIPMGMFVLTVIGDTAAVGVIRAIAGEGVWSGFVGEPERLDNLCSLAELGISRVQLTEIAPA